MIDPVNMREFLVYNEGFVEGILFGASIIALIWIRWNERRRGQ